MWLHQSTHESCSLLPRMPLATAGPWGIFAISVFTIFETCRRCRPSRHTHYSQAVRWAVSDILTTPCVAGADRQAAHCWKKSSTHHSNAQKAPKGFSPVCHRSSLCSLTMHHLPRPPPTQSFMLIRLVWHVVHLLQPNNAASVRRLKTPAPGCCCG